MLNLSFPGILEEKYIIVKIIYFMENYQTSRYYAQSSPNRRSGSYSASY